MGKRLRDGFSAGVKLAEPTLVVTTAGPVQVPTEVFIEAGGELPDGLAEGEEERLEALGAFTPVLPYAERVRLQGAALAKSFDEDAFAVPHGIPPSLASGTAPEGAEVTTPGLDADQLPAALPDDDDVAGPLPDGTTDEHGNVSPDLAHDTAGADEARSTPVTADEVSDVVKEQLAEDAETSEKTVAQQARAKRVEKKTK